MGPTIDIGGVPFELFSLAPVPLLGVVAAALLYERAVGILATRGRTVRTSQRVAFHAGLACILVATNTVVDTLGETSLQSMHMLQHLLIADIPAMLMLYGLRAPVLYFFWPKAILVRAARAGWLRATWRVVKQPPVALGIWLGTLYLWHVPVMYEAALANRLVHDLEHITFALGGILAWWPVLDPTHERVAGRFWKVGYVIAARGIGGLLGGLMIGWPTVIYPTYVTGAAAIGVDPMLDQSIAGGMMMFMDFVIMSAMGGWLLWRMIEDSSREGAIEDPALARDGGDGAAAPAPEPDRTPAGAR